MGIVNMTPDSFSGDGLWRDIEAACEQARRMIAEGASIIDVGGESTRPGSQGISVEEELERVLPVVKKLASEGIPVSIDTRHAEVAAACLENGAVIINDVTGFTQASMRDVAAASRTGCIIVHMSEGHQKNDIVPTGSQPVAEAEAPLSSSLNASTTTQVDPRNDLVDEVESFLLAQARLLEEQGIDPRRIAIDPGPGFGKDFDQNSALLQATQRLATHGYPLVAAWSRKRFIGELTGVEKPEERVSGSVAVALQAAAQGARILRVHDVAETAEALLRTQPL